ncbi:MAG: SGNH/GDSL hydrolase family protein [Kiritimatiellae bacterium]|nr:SGNH/GDSL hydrolase family protein [Kiritimatiellia bacterium]
MPRTTDPILPIGRIRPIGRIGPILLCATLVFAGDPGEFPAIEPFLFHPRQGIPNVYAKLARGGELHIAYLGASVTAGGGETHGWRALTFAWFKATYPNATLVQIHDPTGGTRSDLGAARLGREVLDRAPDLLFVEFAVNDLSMPYPRCIDTIEGIVRQTRKHNPATDVVFVQVLNRDALATYRSGKCPHTVTAQEKIADRYGIPSINVGWLMGQKLMAEGDEWQTLWKECYVDGVHPGPAGYKIYADHIIACLEKMRTSASPRRHELPAPISRSNWEDARLIPVTDCELSASWRPETNESLLKRFGARFPDLRMATEAGETVRFTFRGTAFGVYKIIGPDGGALHAKLDGKPCPTVRFINRYSLNGCRVDYSLVKENLGPAVHEVELRVSGTRPDESKGTAARIAGIILRGELVKPGNAGKEGGTANDR